MIISREKMLGFLLKSRDFGLNRLIFCEKEPLPKRFALPHENARYILCLHGRKHISFARDGEVHETFFEPGDLIFSPPGGWVREHWDSPHAMISVVFRSCAIRTLYISHDGRPPDQAGPDIFYHTPEPPGVLETHIIAALLSVRRDTPAVRALFSALFSAVADAVASAPDSADPDWARFEEVLQSRFRQDLSREELAELSGVHPARLSRMVKAYRGETLREYINYLRLSYSMQLLEQTTLPVNEIAAMCGFRYTNYFIRVFRRHLGITPSNFRFGGIPTRQFNHLPAPGDGS